LERDGSEFDYFKELLKRDDSLKESLKKAEPFTQRELIRLLPFDATAIDEFLA